MGVLWKQAPPFIILVIGGAYALKQISQHKFDVLGEKSRITKFERVTGVKLKPKPLEEEYQDLQKKVNINDWKNTRISRPYEDTVTTTNQDHATILKQTEKGSAPVKTSEKKGTS